MDNSELTGVFSVLKCVIGGYFPAPMKKTQIQRAIKAIVKRVLEE